MDKLKKWLYPHPVLICLLSLLCGAALGWIFLTGRETWWIAYIVYVLSFYALTVLCLWLIPVVIRRIRTRKESKVILTDAQRAQKFHRSLVSGMVMNYVYGGFHLIVPWFTGSVWSGSQGAYQIVIALIHAVLLHFERNMEKAESEGKRNYIGWQGFQVSGVLLLILHLTMTGLVFQMVWNGETENYPGFLIFAVAAYTFYKLTMAVIRVIQSRKNASPLWGAARNIDMSEAQMNLFTLQTALLSVFSGPEQAGFRLLMNSLTGGAVCLLTVGGAVGMIRHGVRRKQQFQGGN